METPSHPQPERIAADGYGSDAPKHQGRSPGQWGALHFRFAIRSHTQRGRNGDKACPPAYPKGKQYTVKAHTRKFTMSQRQFVGDGKRTQEIIKGVIADNVADFNMQLTKYIKK